MFAEPRDRLMTSLIVAWRGWRLAVATPKTVGSCMVMLTVMGFA